MTDIEIPLGKRTPAYRFFEMLPALLSFTIILTPIVLSFLNPLWAAIFIIAYTIMWFVKAIGVAYRTIQGYQALDKAQKIDWQRRLQDLDDPKTALAGYSNKLQRGVWGLKDHYKNLQRVVAHPADHFTPMQALNAIIIAVYNESRDTIEPTIKAVLASHYDPKRTILIIGYEARGPEATKQVVRSLLKEYSKHFYHAAAIMHPSDMPNEVVGKGGNITYAGEYLQQFIASKHIDPARVLVTTLDSDNRPHPGYLAYAMYAYIVDPERDHRAYQPIALYLNNIWDVPAPMRVLATGNSFWTIINATRPHMLRNFASHSQGLASLNATKLWSTRTIVEDGHQYWRSYFTFDGNYEVTPIYVPIYQDAVLAETYTKTMKMQFIQLRRWAYGASDIAYVATRGIGSQRTVPFFGFWARFLRLLDSHVSWASAPIIITFGAWAPLVINPEAARSIIAHELPQVASQLQSIAAFGLFITVFLTFRLLPPRPERYKRRRNLFMIAQWVVMPVTSICYGAASAITAQTCLLLGKYLDKFDVTTKVVRK